MVPDYAAIVHGNAWLSVFIALAIVAGVGQAVVGGFVIVMGLMELSSSYGRVERTIAIGNITTGVMILLMSLVFFAGAAVIRMIGAVSLAVRDIARNSFR